MQKKNDKKQLLWLFWIQFSISAFAFGGGYVVIPLIRKYFVTQKGVFSEEELLDMAAIAQSSPGAIAVNLAVLAGRRTAGRLGALLSGLAAILPPLLLLSAVSLGYTFIRDNPTVRAVFRGMEAGVAALIVDVVADMVRAVLQSRDKLAMALAPAAFLAGFVLQIPVIAILIASALLALGSAWLEKRRTLAC